MKPFNPAAFCAAFFVTCFVTLMLTGQAFGDDRLVRYDTYKTVETPSFVGSSYFIERHEPIPVPHYQIFYPYESQPHFLPAVPMNYVPQQPYELNFSPIQIVTDPNQYRPLILDACCG